MVPKPWAVDCGGLDFDPSVVQCACGVGVVGCSIFDILDELVICELVIKLLMLRSKCVLVELSKVVGGSVDSIC